MHNFEYPTEQSNDICQLTEDDPRGRHQHAERTRTLLWKTHYAAWANEEITPDLYDGAFPEHGSVADGLRYTIDRLDAIHYETERPDIPIDRLIDSGREASILCQRPTNVSSALKGGVYPARTNEVLQDMRLPNSQAIHSALLAKEKQLREDGEYLYLFTETVPPNMRHPEEFYLVINGLVQVYQRAYGPVASSATITMDKACVAIGLGGLGGKVTTDILTQLKKRLGDDPAYYREVNWHPYKFSLMRDAVRDYKSFDEWKDEATNSLKLFEQQYDTSEQKPSPRPVSGNFEAAVRALCGVYFALRREGNSQSNAIAALYENSSQFTALTRGVTDNNPFIQHLGSNAPRVPSDAQHHFDALYRRLPVVGVNEHGRPKINFPLTPPNESMALPVGIPLVIQTRFDQLRRTDGRCPVRHGVSLDADGDDNAISRFQQDIRNRTERDPKIIEGSMLRLTALLMATVIYTADYYRLFDALDYRFYRGKY
jgi:hypothetical protein